MPPAGPRMRKTTNSLVRELRLAFRELDPALFAPRVAAVLYLAGGLLALGVDRFVPGLHQPGGLTAIGAISAVFGAVALFLPWQRWGAQAQLLLAGFAFVLFAAGGVLANGPQEPYLAMLPLPFVFLGFTQRPGTAALLTPVAAGALVVAGRFQFDGALIATLVFALPLSTLVGEALALGQLRRARAEARVERLLEAVRILARVNNPRIGAQLVASLAAELLAADAVAVLLSDRPGSRRLLNRAFFGHPALADAAPLLVDALGEERAFRTGTTSFVADPGRIRQLAHAAGCVRAVAIVPLPGADVLPIGVVIAMWTAPRRQLPASARQAAELLSEEAGRMFQRLRDAAELTHDAETDALTDLANRRTFARALTTLQPGDALVIVDLDHFKNVNDRFGHQTGDETLRSLAACLRDTARQVDCVARYGGEEFAIVLPEAGAAGARSMLARLRESWRQRNPITTFTAGIAVHDAPRDPRDTLELADIALYAAKEAGRDRDVLAPESGVDIVLP
jgi:diguanylate cyclase (GGDEF)-like protein